MFDLRRVIQDLQESLSLDKHPVAMLIGAGCPYSIRTDSAEGEPSPLIPDIRGITRRVKELLSSDDGFQSICAQFNDEGKASASVEEMLSRIRLLQRVVGNSSFLGLTKEQYESIEKKLCSIIYDVVNVNLPDEFNSYHRLAGWVGAISRKKPLEIFTTNYDLLLEHSLEHSSIPFFDGFVGAVEPFFDLRAIEDEYAPPRWVRLWKLHGSINWVYRSDGSVIRRNPIEGQSDGLLIHPSELKYDQSRRMPYLAMMDRLRNFIAQPSSFLVTIGYSYADEHLNEMIMQGLRNNPTAAAYGLVYGRIADEPGVLSISNRVPSNISLVCRDKGVVRGLCGPWSVDIELQDQRETVSEYGDFDVFSKFLYGLRPERMRVLV